MKAVIVVDIPEKEGIPFPLEPFNVKVALDYGDKVIYLYGDICKDPETLKIEDNLDR